MNKDTATGKFEQVAGKVKQKFGEAIGNQSMANSGALEEIKGQARETWGKTKDTAKDVAASRRADAEVELQRTRSHAADSAHDLREKITSTVQNAKESASDKLDDFKQRHSH